MPVEPWHRLLLPCDAARTRRLPDREGWILVANPGLGKLAGAIATVDKHILIWSSTGVVAKLASPSVGYAPGASWPKPFHDRANTNREGGP